MPFGLLADLLDQRRRRSCAILALEEWALILHAWWRCQLVLNFKFTSTGWVLVHGLDWFPNTAIHFGQYFVGAWFNVCDDMWRNRVLLLWIAGRIWVKAKCAVGILLSDALSLCICVKGSQLGLIEVLTCVKWLWLRMRYCFKEWPEVWSVTRNGLGY